MSGIRGTKSRSMMAGLRAKSLRSSSRRFGRFSYGSLRHERAVRRVDGLGAAVKISEIEARCPVALGYVRQALGGNDESDTSRDSRIENMTPLEFTRRYCQWKLGDGEWADIIINTYRSVGG